MRSINMGVKVLRDDGAKGKATTNDGVSALAAPQEMRNARTIAAGHRDRALLTDPSLRSG
jgi:hypothetical protein